MDIHLHHATTHAAHAITHLSSAAFWSDDPALSAQAINFAREYLAKAAAELNAYDAKRSVTP